MRGGLVQLEVLEHERAIVLRGPPGALDLVAARLARVVRVREHRLVELVALSYPSVN